MIEEEKVNIGTEEHPYYIPKNNPFPIERLKQRKKRLEKWAEGYLGSEKEK
jgi:hypothetical protein